MKTWNGNGGVSKNIVLLKKVFNSYIRIRVENDTIDNPGGYFTFPII